MSTLLSLVRHCAHGFDTGHKALCPLSVARNPGILGITANPGKGTPLDPYSLTTRGPLAHPTLRYCSRSVLKTFHISPRGDCQTQLGCSGCRLGSQSQNILGIVHTISPIPFSSACIHASRKRAHVDRSTGDSDRFTRSQNQSNFNSDARNKVAKSSWS